MKTKRRLAVCERNTKEPPPFDRPAEPPAAVKAMAALRLAIDALREFRDDTRQHRHWSYNGRSVCDWCVAFDNATGCLWTCENLLLWLEGETVEQDRAQGLYALLRRQADRALAGMPPFGGRSHASGRRTRRRVHA